MDHSAQDALPPTSAAIDAITVGVIGSVPDRQFGFARKKYGDLYKKDSVDFKKNMILLRTLALCYGRC